MASFLELKACVDENNLYKLRALLKDDPQAVNTALDNSGNAILFYALTNPDYSLDLIQLLLNLGANPRQVNHDGNDALILVSAYNFEQLSQLFTSYEQELTALQRRRGQLSDQLRQKVLSQSLTSAREHLVSLIDAIHFDVLTVDRDVLLDEIFLIQSLRRLASIQNAEQFTIAVKKILASRARVIHGTRLDYGVHKGVVNNALEAFCSVIFPDDDPYVHLLPKAMAEKDGKQWLDVLSGDDKISEPFIHGEDGSVSYLSSILGNAAGKLAAGEFLLEKIWTTTDYRFTGQVQAIPLSLIQGLARYSPSLAKLFNYSRQVNIEESKNQVKQELCALAQGLINGGKKKEGNQGSELEAGREANEAAACFMAWWNRQDETLQQQLLAITNEQGQTLKSILDPLIDPLGHQNRQAEVLCVDTIGFELEPFIRTRKVQRSINAFGVANYQKKSLELLSDLAEKVVGELQQAEAFGSPLINYRSPFPISHAGWERLNSFQEHAAIDHSALAFLHQLALDYPSLGFDKLYHEFFQSTDPALFNSPAFLALKYRETHSPVEVKSCNYLGLKARLAAREKHDLPLDEFELNVAYRRAMAIGDSAFIQQLITWGVSPQNQAEFTDKRFLHVPVGSVLYTTHPMYPQSDKVRGEVIERKGPVIRLRFSGQHSYPVTIDGEEQPTWLTVNLTEDDDREFNLCDDAALVQLQEGNSDHALPLMAKSSQGNVWSYALANEHLGLVKALFDTHGDNFQLTDIIDGFRLLCSDHFFKDFIKLRATYLNYPLSQVVIDQFFTLVVENQWHDLLVPLMRLGLNPNLAKYQVHYQGEKISIADYYHQAHPQGLFEYFLNDPYHFSAFLFTETRFYQDHVPYSQLVAVLTKADPCKHKFATTEDALHCLFRVGERKDQATYEKLVTLCAPLDLGDHMNAWLLDKATNGSEKELIRALSACAKLGITLNESVVTALFTKAKERALTGVISSLIESKGLTDFNPAELAKLAFQQKDHNLFKQCVEKLKGDEPAKQTLLQYVVCNQSSRKPYVSSLVKAGANLWPHLNNFTETEREAFFKHSPELAVEFLEKFRRVYSALCQTQDFKWFRHGNHWAKHPLMVRELQAYIREKPNSRSAKAYRLVMSHCQDMDKTLHSNDVGKSEINQSKAAIFHDLHQLSRKACFFSRTHLDKQAGWEEITQHATDSQSSRSVVIYQRLGFS